MVHKRKIIVYIATSADGYIGRSDGSVDWLERAHPKGNYGMGTFYKSVDTILWGRKTCDMVLDFQKKGVTGSAFDKQLGIMSSHAVHCRQRRQRAWSS